MAHEMSIRLVLKAKTRVRCAQPSVTPWKVSTRRRRRLLMAAAAIARVVAPSATAYASANTPDAMHDAAGNTHSAQLRHSGACIGPTVVSCRMFSFLVEYRWND